MPLQIRKQSAYGCFRGLAAAAKLAQPDDSGVGDDLDDGAYEAPPMRPTSMTERRLKRHGHGGGADIDDLHG